VPHGDTRRSDKLYQLLWRPRPPSLLPEAKEKEIRKNLRDYSSKYEAEDAKLKTLLKGDELKARREKHRAFEEFLRLKARPRRDIAEILPRYRRDIAEILPRHRRDIAEISPRHRRDIAETSPQWPISRPVRCL